MLVAVMGPSASGKSTLIARLRAEAGLLPLKSYTTRPKRDSDVPGELVYVAPGEFWKMDDEGCFLWTVQPYGSHYRYGTRVVDVNTALQSSEQYVTPLVGVLSILHSYANGLGRPDNLRCLYLRINDETELGRRLGEDPSRTDVSQRLMAAKIENQMLSEDVKKYGLRVLDATLPPDKVYVQALAALEPLPAV
jgi:guanylate kinase